MRGVECPLFQIVILHELVQNETPQDIIFVANESTTAFIKEDFCWISWGGGVNETIPVAQKQK